MRFLTSLRRALRESRNPPRLQAACAPVLEQLEQRRLLTVPTDFVETQIATGLARPVAMTVAPDGRIFVAEQHGAVRVIKDDQLLPQPFITLPDVHDVSEAGLLSIAFDPDFSNNGYVYLNYVAETPEPHGRIARVTATGDTADVASLTTLFELDPLTAGSHNGGPLQFGADGKLYFATGDNQTPANAQSLSSLKGKLLRIN